MDDIVLPLKRRLAPNGLPFRPDTTTFAAAERRRLFWARLLFTAVWMVIFVGLVLAALASK